MNPNTKMQERKLYLLKIDENIHLLRLRKPSIEDKPGKILHFNSESKGSG